MLAPKQNQNRVGKVTLLTERLETVFSSIGRDSESCVVALLMTGLEQGRHFGEGAYNANAVSPAVKAKLGGVDVKSSRHKFAVLFDCTAEVE